MYVYVNRALRDQFGTGYLVVNTNVSNTIACDYDPAWFSRKVVRYVCVSGVCVCVCVWCVSLITLLTGDLHTLQTLQDWDSRSLSANTWRYPQLFDICRDGGGGGGGGSWSKTLVLHDKSGVGR